MEFNDGNKSFFIRVIFSANLSVLTFPPTFRRARKNAADVFDEALMQRVSGIRFFRHERSLLVELTGGWALLFRMHGPSGNMILLQHGKPYSLFRKKAISDLSVNVDGLDRELGEDQEYFETHQANLKAAYFTFGREVWNWIYAQGFAEAEAQQQWTILHEAFARLNADKQEYRIIRHEGRIWFSLLPFGENIAVHSDPVIALREFTTIKVREEALMRRREELIRRLAALIQQTDGFIARTQRRLDEINQDDHLQRWGDLLMANMHKITTSMESFMAQDFYDPEKSHDIRLNPTLSPQKNAEAYYRKARNRASEVRILEETLLSRHRRLDEFRSWLKVAQSSLQLSELEQISELLPARQQVTDLAERLPYTEFEHLGFRILVGRSAQDNDALTFQHSFKEDLWLHARDCPGSHVLIKYKSGTVFPKPVIERAAALAAWHSRRKGEALCPVSYTPKKFIRKRKGDPPGAVVMDRESVLMVEPAP